MNRIYWACILAAVCGGCVQTTYHKEIVVHKDASGKITETWEREAVSQPNQDGWPLKFEYLKGIQPFGPAADRK